MHKNIIAIVLVIYAVFGGGLFDIFDNIKPSPTPEPEPIVEILNIDKPSEEVLSKVQEFSSIITDPSDRAKIAIFNYEFAERVIGYETTSQQVNDVYSIAGKIFFQKSLVDKYDGLAEKIIALLEEIITNENHVVTSEEKNKLNEYFMGVAWVLINNTGE